MIHELQPNQLSQWGNYSQIDTSYDNELRVAWGAMKAVPIPCFTPTLATESIALCEAVANDPGVDYLVASSAHDKAFNLGGDLNTFIKLIEAQDAEALRNYAHDTIKLGHMCVHQLYNDVTTIALVNGVTIGGGFEAALSCNTIIAEEKATFVFPELVFNMFPGSGAYTYLSMRISPAEAHKIISSGKTYSAREMFDMGVIDLLVKDGDGVEAVNQYIREHNRQRRGHIARHKARLMNHPVTMEELTNIVDLWVDTAMNTEAIDLKMMARLLKAQQRQFKY